jgi:hypothetical protein
VNGDDGNSEMGLAINHDDDQEKHKLHRFLSSSPPSKPSKAVTMATTPKAPKSSKPSDASRVARTTTDPNAPKNFHFISTIRGFEGGKNGNCPKTHISSQPSEASKAAKPANASEVCHVPEDDGILEVQYVDGNAMKYFHGMRRNCEQPTWKIRYHKRTRQHLNGLCLEDNMKIT